MVRHILILILLINPIQAIPAIGAQNKVSHNHSKVINTNFVAANPGEIEQFQIFLGKLEVLPQNSSHLNPRYPGIVRKVNKSVGDFVKRGEVLASIASNVGVASYSIVANIDGRIVQRNLAVGEFVNQKRLAFSIARLKPMWVNVLIRQGDLSKFLIGQEITAVSRDDISRHETGAVFFISPTVDAHTLSAKVRFSVKNDNETWLPGEYIDAYINLGKTAAAIVIPNSSIVRLGSQTFVYRKSDDEVERVRIKIGKNDLHKTAVLSGLKKGQEIVVFPDKFLQKLIKENYEEVIDEANEPEKAGDIE